jgi:tyrosyl-tRNA synthetase
LPANKGGNTGFYPRPFLGRGFFYVTGNIALKELIYCYKRFNLILGGFTIMTLYDELVARGLIAQVTDEAEIKDLINNGKATFYIGFDPTADSLHVGHFMALCLMKRLQMAGNKPIALIGGGTAMIGDPSGRTDMRQMMTPETIQHNCDCFKKQMSRFIDFSDGKALMVNNADWLMDLNYIDVLREVGAHFSVNRMLTAECYKQRMEKGLSFLEFNYMIMQSYDFYTLYQKYGCNMEFGGDDQWSNMLGGTELIRRKLGKDAYAMTINLLLNSEGKKMGKTQSGAVWLDPNKTSPFDFFQYWRNVSDADVLKCIRMLTFLPLEEIDAMESWEGAQLNQAKEILAFELTKLVHGEEEANKAKEASHALFAGGGDSAHMPTLELTAADFADGDLDILALLVKAELAPSRSDARRAVQQGGVSVADEKITDIQTTYNADSFGADGLMVKRGKKKFVKIIVK